MASHDMTEWFSIQKLSDGERAALLLITEVLLAEPGTLLLIDEPERHLERSISAPLLSSLFALRNDCAFVVSTHDIELVTAMPMHPIMLLRAVDVQNNVVASWDFDLLDDAQDIPDDMRRIVLGSRRKIVFSEGAPETLDQPIYSALFPGVSIRSVGSNGDVEAAVNGLRNTVTEHWVEAFGIVDRDQKLEEGADIVALEAGGIYALSVHSVEALYYGERARTAVANYQCPIYGGDPAALLPSVDKACLALLSNPDVQRNLVSYRVAGRLRGAVLGQLPSRREIATGVATPSTVSIDPKIDDDLAALQALVSSDDIEAIFKHYKIRETGVRATIARMLHCTGQRQYEALVVHLLKTDAAFSDAMRADFGALSGELSA